MVVEYNGFVANLIYCAKTKSYYGEIVVLDENIIFQATTRQKAILAMRSVVDEYLAQQQDFV